MGRDLDSLYKLQEAVYEVIESSKADGCGGCKWQDKAEWEEPCKRCKRNHKDYWEAVK